MISGIGAAMAAPVPARNQRPDTQAGRTGED